MSDLDVIWPLARCERRGRIATGRLRALIRAAQVFGFHLAPLDMRQHSGVHEQVVAELFPRRRAREGYRRAARRGAPALAAGRDCGAATVALAVSEYSEVTQRSCASWMRRPRSSAATAPQALPNYIISKANGVSDMLEVALLLKEAGLMRPASRRTWP